MDSNVALKFLVKIKTQSLFDEAPTLLNYSKKVFPASPIKNHIDFISVICVQKFV